MSAFGNLGRRRRYRVSGWLVPSVTAGVVPTARESHGVRNCPYPEFRARPGSAPARRSTPLRIAIVTPYSWTYPGGVNRHVEALAEALIDRGHEVRVLAPWDPPDRLSQALHRAPAEKRSRPDYLIPLGRTVGIGANGAVSNLSAFPDAVTKMRRELARRALRRRPRARAAGAAAELGRVLLPRCPGGRHLPRLLDQAGAQRDRQPARSPPQVQPAPGADRGFGGRRLDRAALVRGRVSRDPQRRRRRRPARCAPSRGPTSSGCCSSAGRRSERACPSCSGVRGAGRARARPLDRDRRRPRGRTALRGRSGRRARGSRRSAGSTARSCGATCTRPTCSARPRSPERASEWC